jgi:hypothetical protein
MFGVIGVSRDGMHPIERRGTWETILLLADTTCVHNGHALREEMLVERKLGAELLSPSKAKQDLRFWTRSSTGGQTG